jgi:teichuronic acid biosynthesis glycosyltransferase TuaH
MSATLNLVVVPFHDWRKCEREGFRTRDAHLMQQFGRHPAVRRMLVVNRPISLAEIALYRRGWRPREGTLLRRSGGAYLSQVGPKSYTLDLVVPELLRPLRLRRAWTPYIFDQPVVAAATRAAIAGLGFGDDYALFLSAPLFAPLARRLAPPLLIADAQDNLLKHALYRDVPGVVEGYNYWRERADLLYANSHETAAWLGRSDATHIANGVDLELFAPDRPRPLPNDLAALPRPIVGYAGKMQELFDIEMAAAALRALPEVSFVFIGQVLNQRWMDPLRRLPNAHFLGDKPYAQLPNYLAAFDICTIPYSVARQHGGDPIKLYEYLAAGKPVVTTNIGGVGAFTDYPQVRVVDQADQYIAALRELIAVLHTGRAIPLRQLPANCTWAYKADQIVQAARERLHASAAVSG